MTKRSLARENFVYLVSRLCFPSDGSTARHPVFFGIEISILHHVIQIPFDQILQMCAACWFILLYCLLSSQSKCVLQMCGISGFCFVHTFQFSIFGSSCCLRELCLQFVKSWNTVSSESKDDRTIREYQERVIGTCNTEIFVKTIVGLDFFALPNRPFFLKFVIVRIFFKAVAILAAQRLKVSLQSSRTFSSRQYSELPQMFESTSLHQMDDKKQNKIFSNIQLPTVER